MFKHLTPSHLAVKLSTKRILEKWFYFFANEITDPVILWDCNDYIRLDPGTNRYIGSALRLSPPLLDAILITEQQNYNLPNDIIQGECIDCQDIVLPEIPVGEYQFSKFRKTVIKDFAPLWDTLFWQDPVYRWIEKNLKYKWVLDYKGTDYIINQNKPVGGRVVVSDETELLAALTQLFNNILILENIAVDNK